MTLPQMTDAELVVRTQSGDAAAFDELKRRYADDVRRVALVAAPGEDQAADLVAETFSRFLALLRSGARPDGELRPYLRMVVRRLALGRYQGEARATSAVDPFILQNLPGPDATATGAGRRDLVRRAFEMLPADWQQVLWRTEVVGWSPAVLGAALHRPPAAVEALAVRARESLRQAYFSVYATGSAHPGCRPFAPMIPALSRGALTASEESAISAHLGECGACRARSDEVLVLMSDLRTALVPALLGVQADAIGLVGRGEPRRGPLRPSAPRLAGVLTAAAGLVAVAVIAVAMMATTLSSPPAQQPTDPPAVAVPTDDSAAARTDLAEPGSTEEPTEPGSTEEPTEPGDEDPEISALAPPPSPVDPPEDSATEPPADAPAAAQSPVAEPERPAPGETAGETPAGRPAAEATDAAPDPPAQPATQPPDPEPTTAADQPGPPAAGGNPAWLCDLVPSWPGCPDDPGAPGRDAVCARIPDLPFCPAG